MGIINILRREWFVSCRQMTAIADAMPEDKFEYRPVPEVRSYGGIVAHIAGEHQTWFEVLNGAAKVDSMEQFDKLAERYDGLKTKAEALKALNDSYEYGGKYLAGLDEHTAMESPGKLFPISPTWFCIEQTVQHSKEHYGNLVTYLRLNHIVPPASR